MRDKVCGQSEDRGIQYQQCSLCNEAITSCSHVRIDVGDDSGAIRSVKRVGVARQVCPRLLVGASGAHRQLCCCRQHREEIALCPKLSRHLR